jgi:hypothetical protein
MAINWLRYPTDVKQSVRIIPVQVQLPAGSAVANLAVVAAQTSPNVSLYTENGVVVSRALAVPVFPANSFEVYLAVSTIDDHDVYVDRQPTTTPPTIGIDPESQQKIVVTLQETASGEIAPAIYIKVAAIPSMTVSTEKTNSSDDFPGTDLNHDIWTATGVDAGGLVDAPVYSIALSVLSVTNDPADTTVATLLTSDVYEGRCHVEFRGTREVIRANGSSYRWGVAFIDLITTELGADVLSGSNGWMYFSTNWDGSLGGGYTPEANTVIRCNVGGTGYDFGPSTALPVPLGSTTDVLHDYAIDFDGHVCRFYMDGTLLHSESVKIPPTSAKRFVVFIGGRQFGALANSTSLQCDRVDVSSDERLVTTSAAGGGTSAGVDQTPSSPTHGVTTALVNDNSTLVATVQVGKRYRVSVVGTEGVVWTNSAGPAARATDEPVWPMMAREFIATHVSVYAQKLVVATANGNFTTVPLDGGTIA